MSAHDTVVESAGREKTSRTRQWVFTLVAIVLWLIIVWGGAELYVRMVVDNGMQYDLEMWKYALQLKKVSSDPLIGHEHRANGRARLMGVDVATNSHGLRDYEYSYARSPGVPRITMLGDSFTEGWGVPFPNTFSKRIEGLFAAHEAKAEVINTGVGNWDTIQEVEYFLTEAYKYQPDIVVLNFFVNDAEPVSKDKPPNLLLRHCYSCVFLAGRIDGLRRLLSDRPDWAHYYLGLYDHGRAQGWLKAKASVKKLADYCKSHGIKLLVASLPELHDVQHYRLQEITDLVNEAARENGVAFIDLLGSVKSEDSSKLWVTQPDPHPNSLANKLFADALYQKLRTMN